MAWAADMPEAVSKVPALRLGTGTAPATRAIVKENHNQSRERDRYAANCDASPNRGQCPASRSCAARDWTIDEPNPSPPRPPKRIWASSHAPAMPQALDQALHRCDRSCAMLPRSAPARFRLLLEQPRAPAPGQRRQPHEAIQTKGPYPGARRIQKIPSVIDWHGETRGCRTLEQTPWLRGTYSATPKAVKIGPSRNLSTFEKSTAKVHNVAERKPRENRGFPPGTLHRQHPSTRGAHRSMRNRTGSTARTTGSSHDLTSRVADRAACSRTGADRSQG